MKVYFTIFILFFAINSSFSQSFVFHRINPNIVIGDTTNGAVTKGVLKNTSSTTQSFKYVRVLNNIPSGWTSSMCGAGNCFGPEVDTLPPFFTHQLFQLAPGASDTLSIDVFGNTIDFGTVIIHAFITGNPTAFIADTFKVQLIAQVGISEINEVVKNYNLSQNYPNPFNPNTFIKFTIPNRTNVNLTLYDISGKEVIKLLNNRILSGGSYNYNFNADEYGLSSGVYFYQLITDYYKKTLKMVLIK